MKKPLIDLLYADPTVSAQQKIVVVLQLQAQEILSVSDAYALIMGRGDVDMPDPAKAEALHAIRDQTSTIVR
jgi:hypothetical protein